MKSQILFTIIFMLAIVFSAFAQDSSALKGDWSGVLDAGATKLKLVLHFQSGGDSKWTGTMDSPDQGANGLKIDTITMEGQTLKFSMKLLGATYEGTLNNDEITGKFSQGGATLPLNFKRAMAADLAPPKRPQTPQPPFPYNAEDITFENKAANIKLAGTFTTPKTKGPHPAVILISGSGPQDRNESLMGHQPFFVLSDHLTRNGIAVLRFDDRGVGNSTGKFATATSEDFASDVMAGIEFLKMRPEINAKKIGLVGHSEGGMIAPMVSVKTKDIAYLVLMAGPGVPAEELLYEQAALMARAEGASEAAITENRKVQEQSFTVLKTEKDVAQADKKLTEIVNNMLVKLPETQRKAMAAQLNAQVKQVNTPWFRFFMSYDPRATLRQVKVPVLALNGELDLQVAVKQNLPEIAKALKAGGNKKVQTVALPKLNHLFQTAKTGGLSEYAKIEETMSVDAMTLMSNWIVKQTGVKK